jgi:hypothetical protein
MATSMPKTTTQPTIEDALFMYKETVSPSKENLINILNQIPEKEPITLPRRVTRSPYIWIAVTNFAVALCLVIVLYPSFNRDVTVTSDNPFSKIDTAVDQFESIIDKEDAAMVAKDYTL